MAIYFHQKRLAILQSVSCSLLLISGVSLTAIGQESALDVLSCEQQMSGNQAGAGAKAEPDSAEFSQLCTKSLLEMQRSGGMASEYKQKLPAVVLDDILERLENSFTHPVPEYFVSTEFTSSE